MQRGEAGEDAAFGRCEICGDTAWTAVHRGPIRDGAFGQLRPAATVARCGGCGADRLAEECCPPPEFYETEAYRNHLHQQAETTSFLAAHDELQIFPLLSLWPQPLRGRVVADVGCAGGSFLDHVSGVATRAVAIEPCAAFHDGLRARGYEIYPYAAAAAEAIPGEVDVAVSLQVIEHTVDPRTFLADIRPLLKPDGLLLVSTPNRTDFLMEALPGDYPAFFYRVAHRWYFDADSLGACARAAGFEVCDTRFIQRYDMSNGLLWIRDKRPSGRARMAGVTRLGDDLWKTFLESTGRSDCLYMLLRPSRTPAP